MGERRCDGEKSGRTASPGPPPLVMDVNGTYLGAGLMAGPQ